MTIPRDSDKTETIDPAAVKKALRSAVEKWFTPPCSATTELSLQVAKTVAPVDAGTGVDWFAQFNGREFAT